MAGAVRDLWMPGLTVIALGASIIAGMVKLFHGSYISTPLAISVLWALYNIIPPLLVGHVPPGFHPPSSQNVLCSLLLALPRLWLWDGSRRVLAACMAIDVSFPAIDACLEIFSGEPSPLLSAAWNDYSGCSCAVPDHHKHTYHMYHRTP